VAPPKRVHEADAEVLAFGQKPHFCCAFAPPSGGKVIGYDHANHLNAATAIIRAKACVNLTPAACSLA